MNTAIAKDIRRAMRRPSYWSRTRATVTMRGPATPDALQDTARDHRLEGRREDGHEAPGHEQGEADMNGGLASDAIREGAEEHLAEPEPHEQGGDDELGVVRARDPEVAADRRGSAGSIASIASATSDIRRAMRGTNSAGTKGGPGRRPGSSCPLACHHSVSRLQLYDTCVVPRTPSANGRRHVRTRGFPLLVPGCTGTALVRGRETSGESGNSESRIRAAPGSGAVGRNSDASSRRRT